MKNRPLYARMGYALAGLRAALRTEASIRTEALALVAWIAVLCWLQPAAVWWALYRLSRELGSGTASLASYTTCTSRLLAASRITSQSPRPTAISLCIPRCLECTAWTNWRDEFHGRIAAKKLARNPAAIQEQKDE